ncbi:YggS family pyridoxal phosphate-dependent enzyme [soil metagenome]
MSITTQLDEVRARVARAAEAAGRDPATVKLVAVSKLKPSSAIREAYSAGQRDFGENYAQELAEKQAELSSTLAVAPTLRWHYIGRLQSNKAKLVAGKVALVHAVDSVSLAVELGKRAASVQPILLAVNLGGEATKGGVTGATAQAIAKELAAVSNVRLDGLMTLPPPSDDPEASRPVFAALRELRARISGELGLVLPVLSMGMSGDYEVAIACGATHVRIGTAIFGSRPAVH